MEWGRFKKLLADTGDWGGRLQSYAWLGGFGVSAGIFTWLGQRWDALAEQGWAAVVLFGIAAALTTVLVLSIALVAWRLFRPLPPTTQHQAPTPTPRDPEAERDLLILLNFNVDLATIAMLRGLVEIAPQQGDLEAREAPEDLRGLYEARADFVHKASSTIVPGTHRHMSFSAVMQQARHDAEERVRQTPQDRWPGSINPVDLIKYEIARFQCLRAIAFLTGQVKEVEERARSQRWDLIERLERRNR